MDLFYYYTMEYNENAGEPMSFRQHVSSAKGPVATVFAI